MIKPKKILFFSKEQLIIAPNSGVKVPVFGNFTRAFFMSLSLCVLVLFSTLQAQTWKYLGSDIDGEAVGDLSGYSVSLSADGNTVAIAAPGNDGNGNESGHVRVYEEPFAITSPVFVNVRENTTGFSYTATDSRNATFSLTSAGNDNAKFTIDGTTGAVKFRAVPDYEPPGSAANSNEYKIKITASAGTGTAKAGTTALPLYPANGGDKSAAQAGGTSATSVTKDVVITVTNVVDALVFSSASTKEVAENMPIATAVYTASVLDAEVTFSLKDPSADPTVTVDDDNAKFTINQNSGEIKFMEFPDYENPSDASGDNVYHIQITATAGTGTAGTGGEAAQTNTKNVAIIVTNVVEAPVFSSTLASTVNVQENTPIATAVYTASVSNASSKDAVTFSLEAPSTDPSVTADDDNAKFTIDRTSGEIKFVAVPDYETPRSASGDNVYHIQITATAGAGTSTAGTGTNEQITTKDVAITVTDVDDTAPNITSAATAKVKENTTDFAYTITANETATFALGTATASGGTGGGDEALFKLAANKLSFKAAPDFEMPKDTNKDNVYKLELKATDAAGNEGKKMLSITVTDVVEQGTIALPETLAFTDTKVGETVSKVLTISNPSAFDLNVTAIALPTGFTSDWSSGTIAVGGKKEVDVSFKPTEVKSYTGTITIASDAANATEGKNTLSVSGKGVLVPGEPEDVFPGLNLFPNPAADVLNIKLPNQTSPVDIQLVDVNGQVVYERNTVTGDELSIDVSGYRSGVYVLVLESGGKVTKRKVVTN